RLDAGLRAGRGRAAERRIVADPQEAAPVVGEDAEQRGKAVVRARPNPRRRGRCPSGGAVDRAVDAADVEVAGGIGGDAFRVDPAAFDRDVGRGLRGADAGAGRQSERSQRRAAAPKSALAVHRLNSLFAGLADVSAWPFAGYDKHWSRSGNPGRSVQAPLARGTGVAALERAGEVRRIL